MAMEVKNLRAVRAIVQESDALESLGKGGKKFDPFLIGLAKAGDAGIFEECMTDWTKMVKLNRPNDTKYLDITLKSADGTNLLHAIASSHSLPMLQALINNTSQLNEYTDYSLDDIQALINEPVSVKEPDKTPLYCSFPNGELADVMIEYGCDVHQLSFLTCYFTYRKPLAP